jgi:hypothetical protein
MEIQKLEGKFSVGVILEALIRGAKVTNLENNKTYSLHFNEDIIRWTLLTDGKDSNIRYIEDISLSEFMFTFSTTDVIIEEVV